jgi:bacillopeptidase F
MWKNLGVFLFFLLFSFPTYAFVFFFDDMNTSLSDSNWQSGGVNNEWGRGTAYGEICWATDINKWYGKNSNQWLRTKNPIDLTNALSAYLSFDDLLYLATGDYTYLEASTDLTNWDILLTYDSSQAHPSWQSVGPLDISSYKGNSVYIRYRLTSDDSGYSYGWYIDNVKVEGKLIPEPFTFFSIILGCSILFIKRIV